MAEKWAQVYRVMCQIADYLGAPTGLFQLRYQM
jgi:hypothetical protein